jgi:serine/threonine-protein kinase RsbW
VVVNAIKLSGTLTLTSNLREIARLKAWIESLVRAHNFDAELAPRLSLCAEEIATNIITHGYTETASGDIRVRLEATDDAAYLIFEDQGVPFDPTRAAPPRTPDSLEDAPIGGLGIHLARSFSAAMEYRRVQDTNRLVLRFETRGM